MTTEPAGWVNVVHSNSHKPELKAHAEETFPVRWAGGRFPTPADECAGTGDLCTVATDPVSLIATCMCSPRLVSAAVFNTSTSASLPTVAEVLEGLSIGSAPPSRFDAGTYVRCVTAACDAAAPAVKVHLHASSGGGGGGGAAPLDERTIFEVEINGTVSHAPSAPERIIITRERVIITRERVIITQASHHHPREFSSPASPHPRGNRAENALPCVGAVVVTRRRSS